MTEPRRRLRRRRRAPEPPAAPAVITADAPDIAPNDPLLAYLQTATGAVDLETLEMDSPAVAKLRAEGVRLIVPLVSQGELIGTLNLGPRLSEQDYSSDDRRLLDNLAAQAAPALRVGQLVREQEAEAAARQRVESELEIARLIQQNFLPRELPDLAGWQIASYYQPAREVGGDFYDVIPLPDGRTAFVIGDVTDKGVPAALVMSATRSVLRASAVRLLEPGAVLERVNEHLCPDMPEKMFVTCLYAVLDPATGELRFANAGHDVPYVQTVDGAAELRARGMPLGLLPGMRYEEAEMTLAPGDTVLLHSDGIVEAHAPDRDMFGFPRLKAITAAGPPGAELIDRVLADVAAFTGPDAEQEDDITMVTLLRAEELATLTIPAAPGNERQAIDAVAAAVGDLPRIDRLKTAVGEATMNAMEHGNGYRGEVTVRVLRDRAGVRVLITDTGGVEGVPAHDAPDLDAKLDGRQTPRGWGLFLIEEMVDAMRVTVAGGNRILELVMRDA